MTQIAKEDTFVEVDGVRRRIVAGAPIPGYLAAQMDVQQETVPTRDLATPVVDEEASLSQAERTKRASAKTTGKSGSGSASGS